MKIIFLTAAILILALSSFADNKLPDGKLGHPVGTYLTIEGKRFEGRIKNDPKRVLLVDTVNGNKLQKPISIEITNLKNCYLPPDTRIIIRGYESGHMVGVPDAVAKAENTTVPQVCWRFYRYFIKTSCVNPSVLPKISTKKTRRHRSSLLAEKVEQKTGTDK